MSFVDNVSCVHLLEQAFNTDTAIILTVTEHTTMVTTAGGGHDHCLYLRSGTF
jgi:hypothetical protein